MSTHNIHLFSCTVGRFPRHSKNEFKIATVNETSMFESEVLLDIWTMLPYSTIPHWAMLPYRTILSHAEHYQFTVTIALLPYQTTLHVTIQNYVTIYAEIYYYVETWWNNVNIQPMSPYTENCLHTHRLILS